MNLDDLAQLPMEVAMSARVDPNGEISWPIDAAERAINALAGAGFAILGLDARLFDDSGILETAWSASDPADEDDAPTNIARGREEALEALARAGTHEFGGWIVITWASPRSASP